MTEQLHRIVIVGGGAGGIELATRLGRQLGKKKLAQIILVDKKMTHLWKPLLHQVATGSLDSHADELNYRAQAAASGFEFHLGTMEYLSPKEKLVYLAPIDDAGGNNIVPQRQLAYDTLVIAIGSETNDFNTYGANKHCVFLDSRVQAERFHQLLLNHYLKTDTLAKKAASDPQGAELNVAIVGAGATGVELAAELINTAQELKSYGLNHIKPEQIKVTLLEAADRILSGLPPRISEAAKKELELLGVRVLTDQKVIEIDHQGLKLANGDFIPAELKVWAAGIKAPAFLKAIGALETNGINQIVVQQNLQTKDYESIFAIGDCAACPQPELTRGVPPRAQAANQQATHLAKALVKAVKTGKLNYPDYLYRDYGSLISLAKFSAVGNLMGSLTGKSLLVEGTLARLMYISLYRKHQVAIYGWLKTIALMLGDRLRRAVKPKLKLH